MRDTYDPSLSLREARKRYFAANGFGEDGGYGAAWVDAKVGPIAVRIPNTRSRKRAVRFHDLHHVLTEYPTTFRGECEIGAWEVASGCANHLAAWLLNLSSFGSGLWFATGDMWRAFLRGRRSANLYLATFDDALLAKQVGDVRRELRLIELPWPASMSDRAAFAAWSIVALLVIVGQMLLSPVTIPVIAVVSRLGRRKAVAR